jgi:hypothetical protein
MEPRSSGRVSFLRASLPRQAETNTAAHTPYLKRDADGLRLGGRGAFRLSLRQSGIPLLARIGTACDGPLPPAGAASDGFGVYPLLSPT